MKKRQAVDFLTTVFFVGILVSMMLYIGLGLILSDGGGGERSDRFGATFYKDGEIRKFVKYCDYKLFRHVEGENVLIGNEDWLFETKLEENGYDYLLDYVGGCAYSEEQMSRFGEILQSRKNACVAQGADYLLVVIPNSMTVCSEYLPAFLGDPSSNRRLERLGGYLAEQGVDCFLDLTEALDALPSDRVPYNNTEDSINAYGAYAAYDAIVTRLSDYLAEDDRLRVDDVEFITRSTDGKGIAKKKGLEHIVRNKTVSLTESMTDGYRTSEVTEHCVSTTMLDGRGENREIPVIEFSSEWDKIQLMPLLSNTFSTVVYENTVTNWIDALSYHNGTILIQMIHESELDLILQE